MQVQGAWSFAAGYIGRVGEAGRCLDGSLYVFISLEAEELIFFDMLWVLAVEFWNSLTLSHPISVKFLRSVKAYTTKISY